MLPVNIAKPQVKHPRKLYASLKTYRLLDGNSASRSLTYPAVVLSSIGWYLGIGRNGFMSSSGGSDSGKLGAAD